ncbi:helix-turn-helix domain-containing protein [Arthrobacter sp. H20]|uniref:helix-turn-helix transcriptional regulator n=1 Tax=Arthrobacter sp. H20 TaxID=1267981 RepID=UPI0004788B8D|nr:helix-turn-helix domain-containing protein [Arthrobacter sp. H20]
MTDPKTLGQRIREQRRALGATQQSVADSCGVSRKFINELEAGKDNSSLGLALKVMGVLGLDIAPTQPQSRSAKDYGREFAATLTAMDYRFALRLLGDYAASSVVDGRASLTSAPRIDDADYLVALAAITRWIATTTGSPAPGWSLRTKPSETPVFPAEKIHPVSSQMKELIRRGTPPELAAMNVWIRERDLATA